MGFTKCLSWPRMASKKNKVAAGITRPPLRRGLVYLRGDADRRDRGPEETRGLTRQEGPGRQPALADAGLRRPAERRLARDPSWASFRESAALDRRVPEVAADGDAVRFQRAGTGGPSDSGAHELHRLQRGQAARGRDVGGADALPHPAPHLLRTLPDADA